MGRRSFDTIGDVLFWSYANLAMADAAIKRNDPAYGRIHYMIRQKLYYGLRNGTIALGSLYHDEREKLLSQGKCSYCGAPDNPSIDHLWPKSCGGSDQPENLIFSCRSCNSSKNDLDLLAWAERKGLFPPLAILRRYLKLAIRYSSDNDLLGTPLSEAESLALPFEINRVLLKFPPPKDLIWAW